MMRSALLAVLVLSGCPKEQDDDVAPIDSGVVEIDFQSIIDGLDFYVRNGCEACHCNAAEGGCNAAAPRIIGATYDSIDANLRFASTADEIPGPDPWDPHPLKISGASDEDIAHVAAYLGSLDEKAPHDGSGSLLSEGYGHYVAGTCISCHLTNGQGSALGAVGPPISGSNAGADNLLSALSGGVACHPLQCSRNVDPNECDPPPAETCSLLGRIEQNPTVELLTELSDEGERARAVLAYFLSFIAPPPVGGEVEECNNVSGQICTLAGNGIGGYNREDIPSTSALLYYPQNLDLADWDGDGNVDLALVDWNNHRIRIIFLDQPFTYGNPTKEGINRIITIAGDGKVIGTDALNHPTDIAFDLEGNLMVAGWHNQNIYRYINPRNTPDGRKPALRDQPIGLCDLRCAEDGMPVRMNPLGLPVSIVAHPDGRFIFSENNCMRIRSLTVTGTPTLYRPTLCNDPVRLFEESAVETIAGAFPPGAGYSGNDGPARMARFNLFRGPTMLNFGLALEPGPDPDRLYVADSQNHVIRYVDLKAEPPTIHWFAGGPPCEDAMMQSKTPCNAGHRDGLRVDALFNFPSALFVTENRDLYVVDNKNNAIRKIDFATDRVTTVAGLPPRGGFNGDNIPATTALLNSPGGVAVHPDGRIFIGDTNNNRVRVVIP